MNRLSRALFSFCLLLAPLAPWTATAQAPAAEESDEDEDEDKLRLGPEEARRILALPAPAERGTKKEIDYLVRRQQAAFALGDGEARIATLRRLSEITETRDKPSRWTTFLWREISRNGNQTEALELGEKIVDDARYGPVRRAVNLARLGNDYVGHRELAKARRALGRVEDEVRKGAGDDSRSMRELRIDVAHLKSSLLQADGDLAGAEEAIRVAVAAAQAEVDWARSRAGGRRGDTTYDIAIRGRTSQMQRQIAVLMAQGKHAEAEHVARYGLKLAEDEKTAGTTVGVWHGRIALAKLGQRRYQDAHDAAQEAVATFQKSSVGASSERMLTAQMYQVQAFFGLGRWAEADALVARMRADAEDDSLARGRIDAGILQAFLHLVNGRIEPAMKRIESTVRYRVRNYGETSTSAIEAKAIRAMVFQADQRRREALQDYREVFDSVFSPETSFADAEPAGLRGFFMPHAMRSYLRLVAATYRENGGKLAGDAMLNDSFRVADRLRASVVQQALIDSSARAAAANPQLAELIRREQDQRGKMRELTGQLTRQLEEDRRLTQEFQARQKDKKDEKEAAAEKERVKARQAEVKKHREVLQAADEDRRGLLRDLRKRFPEYQALVNPKPPTLDEAAALLARDEHLVSIYPTADGTFVWATSGRRDPSFHFSGLRADEVTALARRLRKTLDLGDSGDPAAVAFDFAAAAQLFTELLAPIWGRVAESKTVIFVASGPLAEVPLATLVTAPGSHGLADAPWLVRKVAVAQVSTAAALQALRQGRKRSGAERAFAGFGDPTFRATTNEAPSSAAPNTVRALLKKPVVARSGVPSEADYAALPPLPETRGEILAIASSLGADERDVYLGVRASRQLALGTPLHDRRVVAFATHGLKPGDFAGLSRPALALAAPAPPGESPLLQLDDVMTLKLNADLVVLSACNTASDDGSAEEAFSGLARGFFFAGARSVLATHWAVETESAEQLVRRAFGHLGSGSSMGRAEALRRAQLELIDGKARAQYRHPFFWAPYALSGDPG